jgi:hypothetical protein
MKMAMKHWWKHTDRGKPNLSDKNPTWKGSGHNTGDRDENRGIDHTIHVRVSVHSFVPTLLRTEFAPLEEPLGECRIRKL